MTHLLAIVVGIGVVDSVNPSTVAPALYLAGGGRGARALAAFGAGVFLTNLVAGAVVALGPGQAILAAVPHPGDHARHLVETAAGAATLAVGVVLWLGRERVAEHVLGNAERFDRSAFVVGVLIMLVEFPTAIPYFAVIATVVGSGRSPATQVTLLAIFNVCFALPVVALLGYRAVAGRGALARLVRLRGRIDRLLALLAPVLVVLVGLSLLGVGLAGLLA
jgi:cytochrome c biogenesis protein CcdA